MEQTINKFIEIISPENIESIKVDGKPITQEDLRGYNISPERFEMIEPIQSRDQGGVEEPELEPVALETPSPAVGAKPPILTSPPDAMRILSEPLV